MNKLVLSSELIHKKISLYIVLIFLAVCGANCSLPKIIILDDPLSPEEHLNLGVVYEKRGELDNALKEYEVASKSLPLAYLYMGNVYFQKKEYKKAEKKYKEAIKRDPQNADAYNNLAWLYYVMGEKIDEAERLISKAIEINPSKEDIYKDTLEKIKNYQN